MGLMKAAGFCLARTLCDHAAPKVCPQSHWQHNILEKKIQAQKEVVGEGRLNELCHRSRGFKSQALVKSRTWTGGGGRLPSEAKAQARQAGRTLCYTGAGSGRR